MNIDNKVFATALIMANVCVYVLHLEYDLTIHKTIFLHVFMTAITLLFHYLATGFNVEINEEEDESVSDQ
jgi:hypothetical protein